mgnify:CR=1 FL=1
MSYEQATMHAIGPGLRQMGRSAPIVDVATGRTSGSGRDEEELVGCLECAQAVALGKWEGVARYEGMEGAPVCVSCGKGEATLTAIDWFLKTSRMAVTRAP